MTDEQNIYLPEINPERSVTLKLHNWFVVLDALGAWRREHEYAAEAKGLDSDVVSGLARADIKAVWDAVYAVAGAEYDQDKDRPPPPAQSPGQ